MPAIAPDGPCEGEQVYVCRTVEYDPVKSEFKTRQPERLRPAYESRLLGIDWRGDAVHFAPSKDGFVWDESHLNLRRFNGSGKTNIVSVNLRSPPV